MLAIPSMGFPVTSIHNTERPVASVLRAAREFEAQLLVSLLGPLEQSFSGVPGEQAPAGSDDYSHMATQALASALSASGGLGIAHTVATELVKTKGHAGERIDAGRSAVPSA